MTKHKHHFEPLNLNWHSSIGIESRIIIGQGTLSKLPDVLSQLKVGKQVLLLKQPDLFLQEIEILKDKLHAQGMSVHILEVPAGESCKSVDHLLKIWAVLHETNFSRQDTLIAIGGGSICDLAGFAAATYLRGINVVLIPTTLLAQVDAAIGGKTAVNFNQTKNMVGSVYFAKAVIVDINTLATLPKDQFISGWAEVIKYGLLEKTITTESEYTPGPKPLLTVIEEITKDLSWDNVLLPGTIAACIKMKLAVAGTDPLESGLRRTLNLGHTLGHALESATSFELSHGEAVAIGMAFAFHLAVSRKQITEKEEQTALSLIKNAELPIQIPDDIKTDVLLNALFHDKKRDTGGIKMVLPTSNLGAVDYKQTISPAEIEKSLGSFKKGLSSITQL